MLTNENNTYITLTSNLIQDERGLFVDPIPYPSLGIVDALQARNFTADTNFPSLVSFVLDMDDGILYLTFNETVKSSTLERTLITFQNINSTTLLENVTLFINESEFENATGLM